MMFEIKTNKFCLLYNLFECKLDVCVHSHRHNAPNNVEFVSFTKCFIFFIHYEYHVVQRKIDTDKKFT